MSQRWSVVELTNKAISNKHYLYVVVCSMFEIHFWRRVSHVNFDRSQEPLMLRNLFSWHSLDRFGDQTFAYNCYVQYVTICHNDFKFDVSLSPCYEVGSIWDHYTAIFWTCKIFSGQCSQTWRTVPQTDAVFFLVKISVPPHTAAVLSKCHARFVHFLTEFRKMQIEKCAGRRGSPPQLRTVGCWKLRNTNTATFDSMELFHNQIRTILETRKDSSTWILVSRWSRPHLYCLHAPKKTVNRWVAIVWTYIPVKQQQRHWVFNSRWCKPTVKWCTSAAIEDHILHYIANILWYFHNFSRFCLLSGTKNQTLSPGARGAKAHGAPSRDVHKWWRPSLQWSPSGWWIWPTCGSPAAKPSSKCPTWETKHGSVKSQGSFQVFLMCVFFFFNDGPVLISVTQVTHAFGWLQPPTGNRLVVHKAILDTAGEPQNKHTASHRWRCVLRRWCQRTQIWIFQTALWLKPTVLRHSERVVDSKHLSGMRTTSGYRIFDDGCYPSVICA